MNAFSNLGLQAELVRAVADEGYTEPTPVQSQAIPVILEGRDVLAAAQTGTGKTAGFTLPILQLLSLKPARPEPRTVRVLVITPTRELAAQVEQAIRTYGKHSQLRSFCVYGGVGMQPQVDALKRGLDILVATPGRLLDHVGQKTVDLSRVEILVLDEADRMLDMGFIRDIRRILAVLPPKRQNLLFSATFSDEIRDLAGSFLHDPVSVEVARRNAESDLIAQRVIPVDATRKTELLAHLVREGDWRQVLVFTRTKHGANRLAEKLCREGIEAGAIHANKSQGARTRTLAGFTKGELRVLVATNIAARGIDIEELPHVVNYELPNVPEEYVHRIGRTGRAGRTGEALAFVSHEEDALLADIEKLLKRRIDRDVVPGFERSAHAPSQPREASRGSQPRQSQPRQPRQSQPRQPQQRQPRERQPQGGQPQARDRQPRQEQPREPRELPEGDDDQTRFFPPGSIAAEDSPRDDLPEIDEQPMAASHESRLHEVVTRDSQSRSGQRNSRNSGQRNGQSRGGQSLNGQAPNGQARNGQARNGQSRDGQSRGGQRPGGQGGRRDGEGNRDGRNRGRNASRDRNAARGNGDNRGNNAARVQNSAERNNTEHKGADVRPEVESPTSPRREPQPAALFTRRES